MVSTYIWVDTIASSDGVRKVCCPDGYLVTRPWLVSSTQDGWQMAHYALSFIDGLLA